MGDTTSAENLELLGAKRATRQILVEQENGQ